MANVLVLNEGRTLLDLERAEGRSLAGSLDAHERNILSVWFVCPSDKDDAVS